MPDPPPYGFRTDFLPENFTPNADPNSGVLLSYGMPMPINIDPSAPPIPQHDTVIDPPLSPGRKTSSSSSSSCEAEPCQILDYSMYPPVGYAWQSLTSDDAFPAQKAVRAGRDAEGCTIYVGRAYHEGDMIPAKVIPDKQIAYISYAGEEVPKFEFEILRSGDFVWEFASNGAIPEGAIEIGRTADGEKLFMGRCLYEGTQTPGKIQPSHHCLYIPFNGGEVAVHEYEVLVVK